MNRKTIIKLYFNQHKIKIKLIQVIPNRIKLLSKILRNMYLSLFQNKHTELMKLKHNSLIVHQIVHSQNKKDKKRMIPMTDSLIFNRMRINRMRTNRMRINRMRTN